MEKMDFLDPNNDCGQSLLKLAAAGSSILAELLRLSNHIPDVFLFESKKEAEEAAARKIAEEKQREKQRMDPAKNKTPQKGKKSQAAAVNESAQKLLEDQLTEDTLRLQQ